MPPTFAVTQEQLKIHVESDSIVVEFPRPMDNFAASWEHYKQFGLTLEKAAMELPNKFIIDGYAVLAETKQIKIAAIKDKYICLFFQWTDRLRFSREAAKICARAIREVAQDLEQWNMHRVRMTYNKYGNAIPIWEWVENWPRKTFNMRTK